MTIQVTSEPTLLEPNSRSTVVDRESYLAQLLKQRSLSPTEPTWLQSIRDRALTLIQDQGLPTTRDEEWRFTDLSPLYQVAFQPVTSRSELTAEAMALFQLPEVTWRLVFVNGMYAPELSAVDDLPVGLSLQALTTAGTAEIPELGQQSCGEAVFSALNTINFSDGAVLRIGKHQQFTNPIHLLFIAVPEENPTVAYPRSVVVAEPGSEATLIEEYISLGEGTHWTNAVTEVWVGENAQLHHSRVQRENYNSFHIGKTAVSQARDSHYRLTAINVGAKISRHQPEIVSTGEQTETNLNGLTLAAADQVADTHSAIAFTRPHGTSRQVHKCIVDDRARTIFNGKVLVPQAAQLTDAGQLSRNLLLSPKARVDTKPQLEIVADNVKCTHGATVSQLDEEELFYLRSRGLDADTSRNLLIDAFAAEILDPLPLASLRQRLATCVACKTDQD